MRINKTRYLAFTGILLMLTVGKAMAQNPIVINGKKAEDSSWMTQQVPSETLAKKKFTLKRRLIQNMITRFNSYYNAHTKLSSILEAVEKEHQDDYDSLLSIYPYAPGDFTTMSTNLDSVIFNASYGIQIHDPRSKWIDNLYLIAGKAYYFKKDYADAVKAFKYIIKNEGAKTAEGAPEVIGSRGSVPEAQISVATPEKKKLFYHRPSRNDAFVWLVRTYIDSGSLDQAASLMSTLKTDPAFPERLQLDLAVAETRLYFHQLLPKKAIPFLAKAAALQPDGHLKARWEYLLGQLYQQRGDWANALGHYKRVIHLPTDPMMHFYAYLNMTELHILQDKEDFATGSRLLLKMARKEKYDRYRSIIYFSLGRMAIKSRLPDKAIPYLMESLRHNPENVSQKLASSRLLAVTFYNTGRYRLAKMYYDSTAMLMTPGAQGAGTVNLRREALAGVMDQLNVIGRQDSLQRLATMPQDELKTYLEQIVKDSLRARKRRNLVINKPAIKGGNPETAALPRSQTQDSQSNSPQTQAWYFYNPALRAKGFSIFRSRWGKRPLADNWRTAGASGQTPAVAALHPSLPADSSAKARPEEGTSSDVAGLMANIPLKPEQKKASDDSIMQAMYQEANIFADRLDNDSASGNILRRLLSRFPESPLTAAIYYRLQLISTHLDSSFQADHYRQLLFEKFPESKYAAALSQAKKSTLPPTQPLASRLYDAAYLHYLTGNYDRVLALKDSAMRLDPENQQKSRFDLLGAMVVIKQQSDSAGKNALRQVLAQDKADTAISREAAAILDALNHKQELIEHLAHLQLPAPEQPGPSADTAAREITSVQQPAGKLQASPKTAVNNPPAPPAGRDTAAATPPMPAPAPSTAYKLNAKEPHFVVLAFNHNTKKLMEECLSKFSAYTQQAHPGKGIEVSSYLVGRGQIVLIFRLFADEAAALRYYKEIREKAPTVIIADVPRSAYRFFIISRDNFILLNNTKDYQGYIQFFSRYYR
ncbi:MAG TPA: tetratricopeptide repeat protein [Chitinophagaceae bacterium]|nr:tetratricopeptide repeat protein [Chitinophagaceae bacterium]